MNATDPATADPPAAARLKRWQKTIGISLFVGYAGYYLGRSCLAIATPLMLDEHSGPILTKEAVGWIASVGVLTYAIGKVLNGLIVDYVGGRQMFLFGMVGHGRLHRRFRRVEHFARASSAFGGQAGSSSRWAGTHWSKRPRVGIRLSGRRP